MISVIVPVYNCEKYLVRSMKSLIDQSIFNQLEIIFVDDGSTDNSSEVIKKYIAKYSNIKLVSQCNKGVSAARNFGIKHATQKYIAFFDSDDIAEYNLYEKLLFLIENESADLSCVNFTKVFFDGKCILQKKKISKNLYGKDIYKSFFIENIIGINAVDKLYKTEIVKKILFPVGYSIGEDMYFVFEYLNYCNKIVLDTTFSLYRYQINESSAMKSEFGRKYFDPIFLSEKIINSLNNDIELYPYAEANLIHEVCKMLNLLYMNGVEKKFFDELEYYKKILKKYSLLRGYKYMNSKHFISLVLMKISPKIHVILYRLLRVG